MTRREPDAGDDEAIVDFLRSAGAAQARHGGQRTLLDHLIGTYLIVRRWEQPGWLQRAALIHSVYGTDAYRRQLIPEAGRGDVAAVAGDQAERLAHLFCATPRRPLFAGTHLWARDMQAAATRDELDAVVLLHMANLADQAQATDGSPGRWLVALRDLAELILDSDAVAPPAFVAHLAALSEDDESLARTAYLEGERGWSLAAAVCPVVPEPCVWLAHEALLKGDEAAARSWAAQARKRLVALGTSWDKRLAYGDWMALIEAVGHAPAPGNPPRQRGPISDPRALFHAVVTGASPEVSGAIAAPGRAAGRARFQRYLDGLSDGDGPGSGAIYPDLPSLPWHDPVAFPLVDYLEQNYLAIRDEILALKDTRFHRESERIGRTGEWDVAFLYERGRRRDDVCGSCPVTARGIESYRTIRTLAGLSYVSRMRPGTHIAPHRGPTNLRVRCHLAIDVPDGDCAIRVGDETRRWEEGKCLVFDDYFPHEAWNHTDDDRIVLIVDLWHPGLSATEVMLLESLQRYAHFHARRLTRYWSANAAAARARAGN